MSAIQIALLACVLLAIGFVLWLFFGPVSSNQKIYLKNSIDRIFAMLERWHAIKPLPSFSQTYDEDYHGLRALEQNYDCIRRECVALLAHKDHLPDIEKLGGEYTAGGIHAVKWKSFVLKWGDFIDENCERCPETTRLLRQVPRVTNALFSVLDPNQYIKPHCGYYKGFFRYHLGVVIPKNNADQNCYIRVSPLEADNTRPMDFDEGNRLLNQSSSTYYWRHGEGVLFDDTRLHDAKNGSDEVRVVLILDMRRRMPLPFDLFNRICLFIGYSDSSIKVIKTNAIPER